MSDDYWDKLWSNPNIEEYKGYVKGYATWKPKFVEIFSQYRVKTVCDAACGFGAYSVMLAKHGFNISGFDISGESVNLTQKMLSEFDCSFNDYKVCSISKIEYDDESFDAVVAHAVIDHISLADAQIALSELFRILSTNGLLFLTFDPLSDEDINNKHSVLQDGSRLYEEGLLFRHYTDDEISTLLSGKKIVYSSKNLRGERELVLQKQ